MKRPLTKIVLAAALIVALVRLSGCTITASDVTSSADDAKKAADCVERELNLMRQTASVDLTGRASQLVPKYEKAAYDARNAANRASGFSNAAAGGRGDEIDADPKVRAAAAALADAEAAATRAADAQRRAETAASVAKSYLDDVMEKGQALGDARSKEGGAKAQLEMALIHQEQSVKAYRKVADSQFHSNTELRAVSEELDRTSQALGDARSKEGGAKAELEMAEIQQERALKAYRDFDRASNPAGITQRAADAKKEAESRAAAAAEAREKYNQARVEAAAEGANKAADAAFQAAGTIPGCRQVVRVQDPIQTTRDILGAGKMPTGGMS
jgi:hypothetical protein